MKSNAERPASPDVCAIIVCAGKGERTGLNYNKVLHYLGQKTVIELVLDAFAASDASRAVIVCSPEDEARIKELAAPYKDVSLCYGGATRAQSVRNGLRAQPCDVAVIHDGARPFASPALINACIRSAVRNGSGIAAVKSVDTVKRVQNGKVSSLPRAELYNTQTPQAFAYADIMQAYDGACDGCTDDAEVYELAGFSPVLVEGEYSNVKITNVGDLVKSTPVGARVGIGFDVHRLTDGRPLILGGVAIPYNKGLDGHSDADVLVHAVMDALLSAAGLPDIGVLFPDTDDRYLGVSSMLLLDEVVARVTVGHRINNVSAVVMAQAPKLAGFIDAIRKSLSARLGISADSVNVSATTTEHMGIIGNGAAIAASASCMLTENHG